MRRARISEDRLKRVLLQDRMDAPDNLVAVLKSDIYQALSNFFEINPSSVTVKIDGDTAGIYVLSITAKAFRVYKSAKLIADN